MLALLLHGNLQYAEIPKNEVGRVIEKAYVPVLSALIGKEVPFALNITGFTLELLPGEVLGLIREGIESGLIEVTGTSYSHAILPLLSLDRVEAQIRRDREVKENLLEVSPRLFFPPELAYDPILPAILKDSGYETVFVDGEALVLSNHINRAIKPVKPLYPHLIKAQRGEGNRYLNYLLGLRELKKSLKLVFPGKITLRAVKDTEAIPIWVNVNTVVMLSAGRFPLMGPKKVAKWLGNLDDVVLYGTDIEFLGYRSLADYLITVDSFIEVFDALGREIRPPSELPHSGKRLYLRTSSWAPDKSLEVWRLDDGNARLNALSWNLRGEKAFLAENSDARGWEPLPERRLDAFRAVYEAWREKS
ncbi:polysaccharide deacetylase family protein [Thermococcus sp. ES12]|uniref:polysaccharide deacetylase family protein n=1 Tax=Thermococcus sp. ES12 TaxID=1638246 RepID=UPI001431367F|nr:polysaccharide deacetylase family protein [Thermococcus sp. ES12]NJE76333.1 hydrolase [Thermococcus sp. ES12]